MFTRALKALLCLYKQVIDQDLEKMNVIGVQTQSVRGVAWMTFTIEVVDARQVARAMAVVGDVPGVRVVRRR